MTGLRVDIIALMSWFLPPARCRTNSIQSRGIAVAEASAASAPERSKPGTVLRAQGVTGALSALADGAAFIDSRAAIIRAVAELDGPETALPITPRKPLGSAGYIINGRPEQGHAL
jgi:hypothetical protein